MDADIANTANMNFQWIHFCIECIFQNEIELKILYMKVMASIAYRGDGSILDAHVLEPRRNVCIIWARGYTYICWFMHDFDPEWTKNKIINQVIAFQTKNTNRILLWFYIFFSLLALIRGCVHLHPHSQTNKFNTLQFFHTLSTIAWKVVQPIHFWWAKWWTGSERKSINPIVRRGFLQLPKDSAKWCRPERQSTIPFNCLLSNMEMRCFRALQIHPSLLNIHM